ncbi:MAG: hypothetical protein KatS3mg129_2063 [Leptospiraceae bacterium]|nr:MAG: hypothetical protein KatS3mg129_2063 [Leptospiraceae bacterium]
MKTNQILSNQLIPINKNCHLELMDLTPKQNCHFDIKSIEDCKNDVVIKETGDVPELEIHYTGNQPLFIWEGDIFIGGFQNRTPQRNFIINKGIFLLPVFCIEQGRWHWDINNPYIKNLIQNYKNKIKELNKDKYYLLLAKKNKIKNLYKDNKHWKELSFYLKSLQKELLETYNKISYIINNFNNFYRENIQEEVSNIIYENIKRHILYFIHNIQKSYTTKPNICNESNFINFLEEYFYLIKLYWYLFLKLSEYEIETYNNFKLNKSFIFLTKHIPEDFHLKSDLFNHLENLKENKDYQKFIYENQYIITDHYDQEFYNHIINWNNFLENHLDLKNSLNKLLKDISIKRVNFINFKQFLKEIEIRTWQLLNLLDSYVYFNLNLFLDINEINKKIQSNQNYINSLKGKINYYSKSGESIYLKPSKLPKDLDMHFELPDNFGLPYPVRYNKDFDQNRIWEEIINILRKKNINSATSSIYDINKINHNTNTPLQLPESIEANSIILYYKDKPVVMEYFPNKTILFNKIPKIINSYNHIPIQYPIFDSKTELLDYVNQIFNGYYSEPNYYSSINKYLKTTILYDNKNQPIHFAIYSKN